MENWSTEHQEPPLKNSVSPVATAMSPGTPMGTAKEAEKDILRSKSSQPNKPTACRARNRPKPRTSISETHASNLLNPRGEMTDSHKCNSLNAKGCCRGWHHLQWCMISWKRRPDLGQDTRSIRMQTVGTRFIPTSRQRPRRQSS